MRIIMLLVLLAIPVGAFETDLLGTWTEAGAGKFEFTDRVVKPGRPAGRHFEWTLESKETLSGYYYVNIDKAKVSLFVTEPERARHDFHYKLQYGTEEAELLWLTPITQGGRRWDLQRAPVHNSAK